MGPRPSAMVASLLGSRGCLQLQGVMPHRQATHLGCSRGTLEETCHVSSGVTRLRRSRQSDTFSLPGSWHPSPGRWSERSADRCGISSAPNRSEGLPQPARPVKHRVPAGMVESPSSAILACHVPRILKEMMKEWML